MNLIGIFLTPSLLNDPWILPLPLPGLVEVFTLIALVMDILGALLTLVMTEPAVFDLVGVDAAVLGRVVVAADALDLVYGIWFVEIPLIF